MSRCGNDDRSALDRVSAFQLGFIGGTPACAAIDEDEVERRRGDLPTALRVDASGSGNRRGRNQRKTPLDVDGLIGRLLAKNRPLSYQPARLPRRQPSPPAPTVRPPTPSWSTCPSEDGQRWPRQRAQPAAGR